jgi:hypothetical protein
LSSCFYRIFVESNAVETNDFHGMASIAVYERDATFNCDWHRFPDVFMVAQRDIGLGAAIGVCQNAALREHGGWIIGQQDHADRSRVVVA